MREGRASSGAIRAAAVAVAVLGLVVVASSAVEVLSTADEVEALVAIRAVLRDPNNALADWVANSGGDPCRWRSVTCSGGLILGLELGNLNLSGTLSPAIGKLKRLHNVFLDHNAISGPIPETIGGLPLLQRLDLSHNQFTGTIPPTLGDLRDLFYMRLNHNNLSGIIPDSLATAHSLFFLDLSFNNLSGTVPPFTVKNVLLIGNPLLRHLGCIGRTCYSKLVEEEEELALPVQNLMTRPQSFAAGRNKTAILCVAIALSVTIFFAGVIAVLWQWRRHHQIFADIGDNGSYFSDKADSDVLFGRMKRYMLKEIQEATSSFNPNNILGQGGFGIVYKGILHDGTTVAVKRLKDFISAGGEDQFHTEVEVLSLVVHRNLLSLIGFNSEDNERLLVYPYMPNGTVACKLQEYVSGKPALNWIRRKLIALGTARGLVYLHEQCDPKIIHRDIKAPNILLDEFFEAIIADFGLAKLLDHGQSQVFTEVRGTCGRIPPEYLMTGESSEKTDVFAYGLLLIELITGRKTLDVHQDEYQKGGLIDWAKELLEEDRLSSFVDKKLGNDYDSAELEEMVQIALLCTLYSAAHRPRMSEVVRMLEGDGTVAEGWQSWKNVTMPIPGSPEVVLPPADYSGEDECNSVELEAIELSGPR